MQVTDTEIPEIKLIEPTVYNDHRGFFLESFNQRVFENKLGFEVHFVQDNHSKSNRGVLRGLHYQLNPHAQGKLVRVMQGEVFDVAVDIRKSSPHFGQWSGRVISAENKRQVWIPPGFAHGFLVLGDTAELVYKTTDYWVKDLERTIAWDCPHIGIEWPVHGKPVLSEADAAAPGLLLAELFL